MFDTHLHKLRTRSSNENSRPRTSSDTIERDLLPCLDLVWGNRSRDKSRDCKTIESSDVARTDAWQEVDSDSRQSCSWEPVSVCVGRARCPQLKLVYPRQQKTVHCDARLHVVAFTDSDHAGCLGTRKSTSSSKLFNGPHMLPSTSTTQVIASSSGETAFHELVKGTSAGLGAVSMLKDFGVDISKNTKIDISSSGSESRCVRWTRHGSTARSREDSSHCYSSIVVAEAHATLHSQNH